MEKQKNGFRYISNKQFRDNLEQQKENVKGKKRKLLLIEDGTVYKVKRPKLEE